MNSIGVQLTKEEVEVIIKEADKDGNGTIDFQEFKEMLKHGPPPPKTAAK